MDWLAENALPIWVCGAVAMTMALIVFFQTRSSGALLGIVAVLGATTVMLLLERVLETPREAVERTLYELAATVEANDVQGTLAYLAPTVDPKLRDDVESLMPQVRIERARIVGTPRIEVQDEAGTQIALVQCRGLIIATHRQNGMKGGQEDVLTMTWILRNGRWLLQSYTSKRDWNRDLRR